MTQSPGMSELRGLLEKATPGEWIKGYSDQAEVEFNGSGHYGTIVSGERGCPVAFVPGMDRPYYDDPETDANIALILAMKASLPTLLDDLAAAQGENEANAATVFRCGARIIALQDEVSALRQGIDRIDEYVSSVRGPSPSTVMGMCRDLLARSALTLKSEKAASSLKGSDVGEVGE